MKDFGDWFRDTADETSNRVTADRTGVVASPAAAHRILPANVYEHKDGTLWTHCCKCGKSCEVEDPEWLDGLTEDEEYPHQCGSYYSNCMP